MGIFTIISPIYVHVFAYKNIFLMALKKRLWGQTAFSLNNIVESFMWYMVYGYEGILRWCSRTPPNCGVLVIKIDKKIK